MNARIVVAGQAVADFVAKVKRDRVMPSRHNPKLFDSESLCAFQQHVADAGYLEAEIVNSAYGFSLRYASGLQDWSIIRSSRNREVDGTYEDAVRAAARWQAQDPQRRWVTAQPE